MNTELFGLNIDTLSFEEAIIKAKNLIDGGKVSQVVTINPEMFEYANKDTEFLNLIKEAEMVIPDGIGVKIALKINGYNVNRIPGVDFAKKLLKEAAINNIPVAIIGAKEEIYHIINDLVKQGISVVLVSSEMQEILSLCDRVIVMSEGNIMGEMLHKDTTEDRIMTLAAGIKE